MGDIRRNERFVTIIDNVIGNPGAIADREADIFELFFTRPEDNSELLIRACKVRKTTDGHRLWEQISMLETYTSIILQIPDPTGHKKVATEVEVRYKEVELLRPKNSKSEYEQVIVTAIEVRQTGVTSEEKGVWWKLLTTLKVMSIEDVKQYIKWYTHRWLIERFHYVIKSGCRIEALQLKEGESLKKAVAMYSLAGFKIMQLTYQSRDTSDVNCEIVLSKLEWQALYVRMNKTTNLPSTPPSLQQVAEWMGRLGGHLGRKSDGPPGLKTIWRGYRKLKDFVDMFNIMSAQQNLGND